MVRAEALTGICKPTLRARFLELGLEVRTHTVHKGQIRDGEKFCSVCSTWKPLAGFRPARNYVGGVRHMCFACERTYRKRHYERHGRYVNVRDNYNLSREEYDALMVASGGKCNICGGINPDGKRLHVEHCHTTGVVRGIVCTFCNTGIARFRDSPELLRRAAEFLEMAHAGGGQ